MDSCYVGNEEFGRSQVLQNKHVKVNLVDYWQPNNNRLRYHQGRVGLLD